MSLCKYCNSKIIFVERNGKKIPVNEADPTSEHWCEGRINARGERTKQTLRALYYKDVRQLIETTSVQEANKFLQTQEYQILKIETIDVVTGNQGNQLVRQYSYVLGRIKNAS